MTSLWLINYFKNYHTSMQYWVFKKQELGMALSHDHSEFILFKFFIISILALSNPSLVCTYWSFFGWLEIYENLTILCINGKEDFSEKNTMAEKRMSLVTCPCAVTQNSNTCFDTLKAIQVLSRQKLRRIWFHFLCCKDCSKN